MEALIGRIDEKAILENLLHSEEPELVAVYGRRRVGKTFLVRQVYKSSLVFEFAGTHNASLPQQLESFRNSLTMAAGSLPLAQPVSWVQAFTLLKDYLTRLKRKGKKVIFFDEFPWLNTPRSGFMPAFEHFWNNWASLQKDLIVVICGSAASWMIRHVVNNRGGLHNRVTAKIRLLPFTIGETEAYLVNRNIKLDRYQILQLYMTMGGIPQYLRDIRPGESATQAIDRICFSKDGQLQHEFNNLYRSLFGESGGHIDIIRSLAKKTTGMSRDEIIRLSKLKSGGGATQLLEELKESGFIDSYIPFGKKTKESLYKLTDEYSRFYLKFIAGNRASGKGAWAKLSIGASWKSWSGLAFEVICMKHAPQLKKALGIQGVYAEISVWRKTAGQNQTGRQIDLLIDRQDNCINICEMKFSIGPYEITRAGAVELKQKIQAFREATKTRKTIFLTLVSTYGTKNSLQFPGLIQQEITMDALFKKA